VHGDGLGSLHSLLSAKLWSPSYVGRQLRNFLDCFPPENAVKGFQMQSTTEARALDRWYLSVRYRIMLACRPTVAIFSKISLTAIKLNFHHLS
jgi:hypothetical protein